MEMIYFNNDTNQTYSILLSGEEFASLPSSASVQSSSVMGTSDISSHSQFPPLSDPPILWNLDKLPSPKALLLNSEWFQQNMTQMLNISADNLTNLITAIQQESMLHVRSPMPLLATLTVCYTLIFIAGVLGNLITCIVISRNKVMHTATNFYLFNLAVSDLILLLAGMPQDLYNLWYPYSYPFGDGLCVLEGVLSETAANATVLTITAFTVERYIAICHPFRQHTMSKLSRAVKFILAIWLTAFVLALPQAMQFEVVPEDGGTTCTINDDFFAHVFAVSGFIFFGGPMTAICVLYVLIGVKLKRSRLLQAVPRRYYDVSRGISAQTRVIRMLIAVAVAFFLCWAPFHAQRLMAVYGSTSGIQSEVYNTIFLVLDYTSGVLYFLSTCINPLLYNIMSHKFREAFKVTLARQFFSERYQTQNHNYSALMRQNGSLRMHHTTDSIRTTTTTTTINSASGGSSQHRGRSCQPSLLNTVVGPNVPESHRLLQTQISQLSSVGDANSLLECEMLPGSLNHSTSSCRSNENQRQKSKFNEICLSKDSSRLWREKNRQSVSLHETELFSKPMGSNIMAATLVATQPIQPMNSIAELSIDRPTRSRLKLSRIITRRQEHGFVVQSVPRVELMRRQQKLDKSSNTLNSLAEKFKWHTKRKATKKRNQTGSIKNTYDNNDAEQPTATMALMKVVYTTSAGSDRDTNSTVIQRSEHPLSHRPTHAL